MSSSPIDKKTMGAAGGGAQQGAGLLQGYGAGNQNFANTQRNQQFGQGGSLTGLANPASLNVTNPTGAYATQYGQEANQVNQGANQSLESTNRMQANRGGGVQPSGAGGALALNAYQGAANAKAGLFAQNTMAQQNQATQNFWNANNAYSGQGGQAAGLAGQQQEGANNTYDNLYGKAGQQKKSTLGTIGGVLAGGLGAL